MTTSIFGSRVLRTEDPRFLTGAARYVDDQELPGALRAAFVRSMMAHARVTRVDLAEAAASPGVVAVLTAGDLDLPDQPPSGNAHEGFARPVLAWDVVRYVGEPVAVVVAETSEQAEDAAELVVVEYDPLPVVIDAVQAASDGSPLLFPERRTNVADSFEVAWDEDVLAGAEVVARGRFVNQRLAAVPMETNAFAAVPDPEIGGLRLWASTQVPFDIRNDIAEALGLERSEVHCIAPDVGGGFGAKLFAYPEHLVVAAAAHRLDRPVRWSETRSESMVAMTQGRAQIQEVEIGATRDGRIVGLRVELTGDMGAYPIGAFLPTTTQEMVAGVYGIPRIAVRGCAVVTNTTPIYAYRGAGRPEATALIERAVDLLAAELGMDPVELRRRNLLPPDVFPYRTPVGALYDSGDYEVALDRALELAGYEDLRREQARRRENGARIQLGIGVSTYVEVTVFEGREFGSVEVCEDGSVTVLTGTTPTGQGHETAFAQLAAGILGVPLEAVRVVHSDTKRVPRGDGTYGSRSLQVGGSAVWEASHALVERARRIAAHALEADPADVVRFEDGRFGVAGFPDTGISLGQVAAIANDPARIPEGMATGLEASTVFHGKEFTYPFGTHVAVAEVDVEIGDARLVRHVAVDDCGRILNPVLVDGQVHGGVGQGVSQALFEEVRFDEFGTPLTTTLASYPMPSAAELPSIETDHTETPTPLNEMGVKGIGESGTIGSLAAAHNAVVDALGHLGVRHVDMPCTPERVWRAIREARADG